MTWFLVDDQMHLHRKFRKLGKDRMAATGVWTTCGSWASAAGTDGFVPTEEVQRFDPRERLAGRLVEVGLWERAEVDGEVGYRFHDHEDWRPSSAGRDDTTRRSPAAERQARKRARDRAESNGQSVTSGVTCHAPVTRDSHSEQRDAGRYESRDMSRPPSPGPPTPSSLPFGERATETDPGAAPRGRARETPRASDLAERAVAAYLPVGISRRARRELAILCDQSSADGATWAAIGRALIAWAQRSDCGPGLLPHLVDDAVKAEHGATAGRPAAARPSTTDAAVAAVEALRTGTGTDDARPDLRALPGGHP